MMDEERAREILGTTCLITGLFSPYINWQGDDTVAIRGEFTAEDLEAIVWWMRNK